MAGGWFQPITPSRDAPVDIDTSVAHIARMQNYWRGGKDNFAADRAAAQHAMAAYPDLVSSVRANQAFLSRSVRYLAGEAGVRQFLDIGTGLPAAGSVHEIAQDLAPASRVVYVDNDPIVLAHARALLASSPPGSTSYVDADVRDTSRVLEQAAAALDFSAPVAVILVSVLHMIQDHDDPHAIVARLMGAVPPGSFLALTNVASDLEPEAMAEMARRVNQRVAQPTTPRDYATVARFFADLELVAPGVVRVPEWRPSSAEAAASPSTQWGGVGRKA
jgi:hypothetical protein